MNRQTIFKYYASKRPYFLAFVRTLEIANYQKAAPISGQILDFGSGDGFFLATLAKFAPELITGKVTGLDLIQSSKSPIYAHLRSYSGEKIPYPDKSFNNAISNCVLEHVPKLELSLKEIHRVLKPRGRFLTTVMGNRWNSYCRLPAFFWDKVQIHFNLLSEKEWEALFKKSGFKIVSINGYLDREQTRFVELGHFASLPYLLGKKLFADWGKFAGLCQWLTHSKLAAALLERKVSRTQASAFYFELQKV